MAVSPVTSSQRCMSVDFNAINEHEMKELHVCHVAHHASVETHMDITGPIQVIVSRCHFRTLPPKRSVVTG